MSNRTQNQPKVAANQSQGQQVISDVQARTIDEIRNRGMDPETLQKIQHDKAEMDRLEKENAERLKGNYISFKEDKERKVLLFSGKYQKLDVPTKDVPEWVWLIAKAVASASDALPPESVDVAQQLTHSAPIAYASVRRYLVVNTLTNAGSGLL